MYTLKEHTMINRFWIFYREFEKLNHDCNFKIYRMNYEYDSWPSIFKGIGLSSYGEAGEFIIVGYEEKGKLNIPHLNADFSAGTAFVTDICDYPRRRSDAEKGARYEVYRVQMNTITDVGGFFVHYVQE